MVDFFLVGAERSLLMLKRIENILRMATYRDKSSSLGLLAVDTELVKNILNNALNDFALKRAKTRNYTAKYVLFKLTAKQLYGYSYIFDKLSFFSFASNIKFEKCKIFNEFLFFIHI